MKRFLLVPLLVLSGCTMDVSRLREINPQPVDFSTTLAYEYRAYADSEMELGHYFAADHFAGKGLQSLAGEVVDPEPAASEDSADLRIQLVKLLSDDVKKTEHEQAARAQLLYDCWQNALSRNLDHEQSPCADEFKSAYAELQEAVDPLIYDSDLVSIIEFEKKSKTLNPQAEEAIKEVADHIASLQSYRVQLEAYMGKKLDQRKMTEARLLVVRKALVGMGVSERAINVKKIGSAKAVILSGDDLPVDTKKIIITVKMRESAKGKP
jgi:outer membrane protein OmpA-like peptidoglycan-associated protein